MKELKFFFLTLLCGVLLNESLIAIAGEDDAKSAPKVVVPAPAPVAAPKIQRVQSQCLVAESAIEDLKRAREENEAKQKELTAKESELKAREQALTEELKKLDQARDSISKLQDTQQAENLEKVTRLVETFLAMSPKAASKIIAALDETLAVSVLSQMDTQRLAKIMNVMDSAHSSKLSELMAGVVRAKAPSRIERGISVSQDTGVTTIRSAKGGEKNEGHKQQYADGETQQLSRQQSNPVSEKAAKPN